MPGPPERSRTVVASANVLGSLPRRDAAAAVAAVLEHRPDLVALQEWHPWRAGLLRTYDDLEWYAPLLGGCALGARRGRFTRVSRRTTVLSPPGRADRQGRRTRLEPARLATTVVLRDREGGTVALIGFHLVSQVQGADHAYREDRPRLVARHRRETHELLRVVRQAQADGHTTYACGDSNLHGFAISGLVSAWTGRTDAGGTLGPTRRVDDVHGPRRPRRVELVDTPSDHRAVVATY